MKKGRKHGAHRKRRPRRPLRGMLVHIDGSAHQWFCDHRWYDLVVVMDDATSEIFYAQLVTEESTRTVMTALREVLEIKGLFCALYSDRASHFFLTPKAWEAVDRDRLTQVGRGMKELGVKLIPQRLGKVPLKSSVTFSHSHSPYCWIVILNGKTKTGHFMC